MFNGIIESLGKVRKIETQGGGKLLRVACKFAGELSVDESININGVCQTVVNIHADYFDVQVVEETLSKTALGQLNQGDSVNLERSLRLSERISGHIVQGHVDTTGTISSIQKEGMNWLLIIRYPKGFNNLIVGRGSISIDGISLTVARENENEFTVAIIPFTLEHTNLKFRQQGDLVNLEFDIFGKYAVKYLKNGGVKA